jgi:putative redox protein
MPAEEFDMKIQVRQTSASASEAEIRNHQVTIDRPVDKGGTDSGPMGGELFLAAVAGCFMSNLLAAMNARQLQATGAHTDVTAAVEGTPPQFTRIELAVFANNVDRDLLEKLVVIAERGCIMVTTLRDKLDLVIRVAGP